MAVPFRRDHVSGHGFIRAVKPLKMNNSTLPKARAQRSGAPEREEYANIETGLMTLGQACVDEIDEILLHLGVLRGIQVNHVT